jgi:hypothetical protein
MKRCPNLGLKKEKDMRLLLRYIPRMCVIRMCVIITLMEICRERAKSINGYYISYNITIVFYIVPLIIGCHLSKLPGQRQCMST